MFDILQFPFMQRALIAGVILAALLALLGVFVMLRKMSFFADGMAHASLAGVALGILFSTNPLITALILTVIFSLVIYWLEKQRSLHSDTIIGIIFTAGMSLGVLLMTLKSGYQPELVSFLFGNILSVGTFELWLIGVVAVIVYLMIILNFKALTLLSLDDESAQVAGYKINILQPMLYAMLAASVVLGIKILGIILVSGLLIIPVATAKLSARSFKRFVISSIIFAELIVVLGIVLSYYFDLPTGPVIVLTGVGVFLLNLVFINLNRLK